MPKLTKLQREIERLTIRLQTCPMADYDKVKAALSELQAKQKNLRGKNGTA